MGEGYIVCYFKEWLRLEILMVLVWKQMECIERASNCFTHCASGHGFFSVKHFNSAEPSSNESSGDESGVGLYAKNPRREFH